MKDRNILNKLDISLAFYILLLFYRPVYIASETHTVTPCSLSIRLSIRKQVKKITACYIRGLSGLAGILLLKRQQYLSVNVSHQSKPRCRADTLIQNIQGQACFVTL